MRCFRWHISIYTNEIKLHYPRHCKNKRQQIFSHTYGGSVSRTSGVSIANQITSLVGQNLADRPEFLGDFWSGPILASDDIREHMAEAKNGPDRTLSLSVPIGLIHDSRHVGFQIVMQISHVLCWGQTLEKSKLRKIGSSKY